MCVIFAVSKTRPTGEQIAQAYAANPRGAGIAWREVVDGKTVVRWKKGMDLKTSQEMTAKAPMPFVIHFRIPSIGPDKPQFNHPFPISANVELALEGETEGSVLFHNGTWSGWRDIRNMAHFYAAKLPLGDWSDSRAMAYAAWLGGLGELTFIDERVVAFGPNTFEIFNHKTWTRVEEGFWASNNGWSFGRSYTGGRSNSQSQSQSQSAQSSAQTLLPDETKDEKKEQSGGTAAINGQTFRTEAEGDAASRSMAQILGGGDQQERLQGSAEGVHDIVERGAAEGERREADLIESQGQLRQWIAGLNPKRFLSHVH